MGRERQLVFVLGSSGQATGLSVLAVALYRSRAFAELVAATVQQLGLGGLMRRQYIRVYRSAAWAEHYCRSVAWDVPISWSSHMSLYWNLPRRWGD